MDKYSSNSKDDRNNSNLMNKLTRNVVLRLKLFMAAGYTRKIHALFLSKRFIPKVTAISRKRLSEEQWNIIQEHLPPTVGTLVDIGSDKGFFSFKMAQEKPDCQVTAIEVDDRSYLISNLINQIISFSNISIIHKKYDPKIAEELSDYDVLFLLSVYSQWCVDLGNPGAFRLLEKAWDKTNQCLFFSMADSATSHSPIYQESLTEFGLTSQETKIKIAEMLGRLKGSRVEYLGSTFYWGRYQTKGGDIRHIYKVSKTEI